ncbi:MAG: hypothetical protein WKG06_22420 [Segetibacter sp.]
MYWISLKPWEVSKLFYEKHQIQVSHGLVKRLLRSWDMATESNPNNWLRAVIAVVMNNFRLSVL